jgi:hypothetical protein
MTLDPVEPNTYLCGNPETVELIFDAHPSRDNVRIRKCFDDGDFETVKGNSVGFVFLGSKRKLTLTFAFLVDGDCDIEITTVTPLNDQDNASSVLGVPVQKEYYFIPE